MTERDFDRIFKNYNKSLVWFCMGILSENYQGEDIVAEVMIKLYHRLNDFDNEGEVKKWLYTSCKNACLNANKHTRVKGKQLPDEYYKSVSDIDIEDRMVKAQVMEIIIKQIQSAPKRQAEIMKLRYEGLSNIEISQILGITVDTIRVQIKRFRDSIQLAL